MPRVLACQGFFWSGWCMICVSGWISSYGQGRENGLQSNWWGRFISHGDSTASILWNVLTDEFTKELFRREEIGYAIDSFKPRTTDRRYPMLPAAITKIHQAFEEFSIWRLIPGRRNVVSPPVEPWKKWMRLECTTPSMLILNRWEPRVCRIVEIDLFRLFCSESLRRGIAALDEFRRQKSDFITILSQSGENQG